MPNLIADLDDPRLAPYRELRDSALRRRIEAEGGFFILEGARVLRVALDEQWPLLSVLLLLEKAESLADLVALARERRVPVHTAERPVFDGIAGFPVHRGVLALARRPEPAEPFELLESIRVVVVVEGVNDHENLGAIFRNAAALGAGAVLLDPSTSDPLYRRSVRVSLGQVLRLPFARLSPWPEALSCLPKLGFAVVGLDPRATSTLDDPPPPLSSANGQRLALLVGSEGDGLSDGARRAASQLVRIPMVAGVDSLNVATALAVALHSLARRTD